VLPVPLGVALGIACAASFGFGVACAAGCRFGYRLRRFVWLRCCLRRWVSLWVSPAPLPLASVLPAPLGVALEVVCAALPG